MMLSFWTDAIVALLLIATIGYSVVLNRRLTAVRSDRDKFEEVVRNLNTASQRAEAAVANLRGSTEELGRRVEKKIDEARALSDDLVYMIERGGTMADKLANLIRSSRDGLKPDLAVEPKPARPAEPRQEHRIETRQEHRIEPVVRQAARPEAPRPVPARTESLPRPMPARAESYHVEPRPVVAARTADQPPPAADRANSPSRAERELLRALARRR